MPLHVEQSVYQGMAFSCAALKVKVVRASAPEAPQLTTAFMAQSLFDFQPQRKVYSVSELSQRLRGLLETQFPDVWVAGEISNFRPAASGHLYFTLKDANAQLRAVCFRMQARYLKFKPQDGVSVVARGRLSIYEARGEYQLLVELLEPAGLGALQLAFEQLKAKLAAEGLFETGRKKPLPVLPRTIGIVSSPSGAVVRDILRVLRRRYRNMNVLLYPARVQGEGAAQEIVQGIEHFNRRGGVEVMILARGGGSLEDLWAFNQEEVARAIAASKIPIISGVGHETDFTIADFVADLRAPTPSAAAELVVHRKEDFQAEIENRVRRLSQLFRLRLAEARQRLTELRMHRVFQTLASRLAEKSQRVDDDVTALDKAMRQRLNEARQEWLRLAPGVRRYDLHRLIGLKRARLDERAKRFETEFSRYLADHRNRLTHVQALLRERSPLVIIGRGYSITRDASGRILRDAAAVPIGSDISVRLARGELGATVRDKKV
jgi:exodeoxyribonuclease VII large subunit